MFLKLDRLCLGTVQFWHCVLVDGELSKEYLVRGLLLNVWGGLNLFWYQNHIQYTVLKDRRANKYRLECSLAGGPCAVTSYLTGFEFKSKVSLKQPRVRVRVRVRLIQC